MQEPQPLGCNLDVENIDAGRVAARSGKAGNETELNRVFADAENDWNRRSSGFGGKRRRVAARRGNHGNAAANQAAMSDGRRSYLPSSQWYSNLAFWPSMV